MSISSISVKYGAVLLLFSVSLIPASFFIDRPNKAEEIRYQPAASLNSNFVVQSTKEPTVPSQVETGCKPGDILYTSYPAKCLGTDGKLKQIETRQKLILVSPPRTNPPLSK